jgi:pimeloyl-ACP methyl ester carboxylesterase
MNTFNHSTGSEYLIDDAVIYYEITGNKDGPVMLLLHGGFGTMEDFNPILPLLNTWCIIGVDSRGHGKSTLGGKKLTYGQLQQDIESLLQYLNIKLLSILGLSDGGIVAYRLATFSRLKIDKLITIGSRWHIDDALQSEDLFLKMTPESWKDKFSETVLLYQRLNPEADFNQLFAAVISMWLDNDNTGYPNEQIKQVICHLLIARGDKDHLTTRKSVAKLADLVKGALLLNIPFAGHVAYIDQHEIFEIALKQFLEY